MPVNYSGNYGVTNYKRPVDAGNYAGNFAAPAGAYGVAAPGGAAPVQTAPPPRAPSTPMLPGQTPVVQPRVSQPNAGAYYSGLAGVGGVSAAGPLGRGVMGPGGTAPTPPRPQQYVDLAGNVYQLDPSSNAWVLIGGGAPSAGNQFSEMWAQYQQNAPPEVAREPLMRLEDRRAAEAAQFARAKDRIGRIGRASMNALAEEMSARGLAGSGIEGRAGTNLIAAASGQLGDVAREQAIQALQREMEVAQSNQAAGLTMRGQDIGQRAQVSAALEALLRQAYGEANQFRIRPTPGATLGAY